MLEAMKLREESIAQGTPDNAPLDFGIGLAIGEVMFGNIGVSDRLAFSGVGRVVNKVQRIETATKDLNFPVLATSDFAEAAPGDWTACGGVEIPDFDRTLEVFTLPALSKRPVKSATFGVEPAE